MAAQGDDPRYAALTKLARCRLSYARTTTGGTSTKRMSWKFTDQDKGGELGGTEPGDARYATIPLNFGSAREVALCLYTADIQKDLDCSWENLWWVGRMVGPVDGSMDALGPHRNTASYSSMSSKTTLLLLSHAFRTLRIPSCMSILAAFVCAC